MSCFKKMRIQRLFFHLTLVVAVHWMLWIEMAASFFFSRLFSPFRWRSFLRLKLSNQSVLFLMHISLKFCVLSLRSYLRGTAASFLISN